MRSRGYGLRMGNDDLAWFYSIFRGFLSEALYFRFARLRCYRRGVDTTHSSYIFVSKPTRDHVVLRSIAHPWVDATE